MSGYRPDGLRVTLAPRDPFIEPADVTRPRAPTRQTDRIRRFDEGPLQVTVDVGARGTKSGLPPARVNARGGPRIAGQLRTRDTPSAAPPLAAYAAECYPRTPYNLTVCGGAALSFHQRDSNPRFGLERAVPWSAATRTYAWVATGGCHGAFEWATVVPRYRLGSSPKRADLSPEHSGASSSRS
jgi:hypothetical protein